MLTETTSDRSRRPLVIAHRGASAEAPEHTIAALELAIAHGADAIELDIHLSRDDQPVVIHDFTLERTTNGRGRVREHTARELKRLDAGVWRGAPFQGQRIQTLQEVFERFRDRTRFWIELKGGSDVYQGIEERVVSTMEVYDVLPRALVQSFDYQALDQVRILNPEVRLGFLAAGPPFRPLIRSGTARAICPGVHQITEHDIADIRQAGLECYVWTVNEPAQMDRLIEWGVSGIITDRPGLLRARVDRQFGG
jgi:glycerophosphoryl diester phosphodiesterase